MGPWGPISHSVRSVCALSAKDAICISAHLCSPAPNLALIFSLKVQCVKFLRTLGIQRSPSDCVSLLGHCQTGSLNTGLHMKNPPLVTVTFTINHSVATLHMTQRPI